MTVFAEDVGRLVAARLGVSRVAVGMLCRMLVGFVFETGAEMILRDVFPPALLQEGSEALLATERILLTASKV